MRATQETKPQASGADSLGTRLCAAREQLGLSVHKAAQDMHVSDDVIEALERDDFAHMGAPIFVRGHLRNYARLLGLPENEILAAENAVDKLAPPALVTQAPGGGHTFAKRYAMPVFSALIVVLLLVLGVVWWLYRPVAQTPSTSAVHDTGITQHALTQSPVVASSPLNAAAPNSHIANIQSGAGKPAEFRHHETMPANVEPLVHTAANAAMQPAVRNRALAATSHAAANVPSQHLVYVQFTLSQSSWIEVYDASGKRLYYDLAPAGDNFEVSGAGPLQVFLGNAPGVSIDLNGAPFNLTPYMHPDNTARFRLGAAVGSNGSTG